MLSTILEIGHMFGYKNCQIVNQRAKGVNGIQWEKCKIFFIFFPPVISTTFWKNKHMYVCTYVYMYVCMYVYTYLQRQRRENDDFIIFWLVS
jgi:hypothetical protein